MKLNQDRFVTKRSNSLGVNTTMTNFVESIFGVIYVLLKDDEPTIYLFFFLSFTEFLEFMNFPFSDSLIKYWDNSAIAIEFGNVIQYINIVGYLHNQSIVLYLSIYFVFVVIVILIIINIAYVSVSFSRKYFSYTWPLILLTTVFKVFVTILFMPIFELFLSMYTCSFDETSGNYVNNITPYLVCFEGLHIFYMTISSVVTAIFLAICITIAINFYEYSEMIEDIEAKENSRADIVMILSKMISTIVFSFFSDPKYSWLLTLVTLICSGWQFFKFFLEKPNYNRYMHFYICILNGIYFWASVVLTFSHVFYSYKFTGSIYIFLFGIPLVAILVIFKSDDELNVLKRNMTNMQKGEEVQLFIRYFLRLVEEHSGSDQKTVILNGFFFNHEKTCELPDCPIHEYLTLTSSYYNDSEFDDNTKSEKHNPMHFLLRYINRVFNIGISKFPNCTSLRIKYAVFLWERMKNKNSALHQLAIAEKYNPPLDQTFNIYRYRKIISEEEDNNKGGNDENLDLVSGIAFESHYKQLYINIEKASQLYLDFWELLLSSNATPDVTKLNDLGIKLKTCHTNIENHWKAMQKYKPNSPKALRLYSGYLINVLNNRIKGNELMQLYQETQDRKQLLFGNININMDESILSYIKEGSGFVICKYESDPYDKNYGLITKISSAICKIFGFLENELISKNLESLFLDVYKDSLNFYIEDSIKQTTSNLYYMNDDSGSGKSFNEKENIRNVGPKSNFHSGENHIKRKEDITNNINSQQNSNNNNNTNTNNAKPFEINYNKVANISSNPSRLKNIFHNYFVGDIFFGKAKNHKAIPLFIKVLFLPNLLKEDKSFVVVINSYYNISHIKTFNKNAFFIVNSSLKLVTSMFTHHTFDVMNMLNRKLHENMETIYNVFPEILKKNNKLEYEEKDFETDKEKLTSNSKLVNLGSSKNVNLNISSSAHRSLKKGLPEKGINKSRDSLKKKATKASKRNSVILELDRENEESMNLLNMTNNTYVNFHNKGNLSVFKTKKEELETSRDSDSHHNQMFNNNHNQRGKIKGSFNLALSNSHHSGEGSSINMKSPTSIHQPSFFNKQRNKKKSKEVVNDYKSSSKLNNNQYYVNGSNKNVNHQIGSFDRYSDSRNYVEESRKPKHNKYSNNDLELFDYKLSKTVMSLNSDPVQILIRKTLDGHVGVDCNESTLTELDQVTDDCLPSECAIFSLPLIKKLKESKNEQSLKKRKFKYHQYFCVIFKVQYANVTISINPNVNIGNFKTDNKLFFDLKRLVNDIYGENEVGSNHIMNHTRSIIGGITNYYNIQEVGEKLKDVFNEGFDIKENDEEYTSDSRSSYSDYSFSSENELKSSDSNDAKENLNTASFVKKDAIEGRKKDSNNRINLDNKDSINLSKSPIKKRRSEKKGSNFPHDNNTIRKLTNNYNNKLPENITSDILKLKQPTSNFNLNDEEKDLKNNTNKPNAMYDKENKKDKSAKDLSSEYILGFNYDKFSSIQVKEMIFNIENFGDEVITKLIIKDNVTDILALNQYIKPELDFIFSNQYTKLEEQIILRDNLLLANDEVNSPTSIFSQSQVDRGLNKEKSLSISKSRDSKTPKSLKLLFSLSLLYLALIIGYLIMEYNITNKRMNTLSSKFGMLESSMKSSFYLQESVLTINQLVLTYNGILKSTEVSRDQLIEYFRLYLSKIKVQFENIKRGYKDNVKGLSQDLDYIFTEKIIPFTFFEVRPFNEVEDLSFFKLVNSSPEALYSNKSFYIDSNNYYFSKKYNPYSSGIVAYKTYLYSYIHAYETQVSFLLYLLSNFNINNFYDSNKYVIQLFYNSFSSFFDNSTHISDLISNIIDKSISEHKIIVIIIFISSIVMCAIGILTFTVLLTDVESEKKKIIHSFYKLPLYYIKWLSEVCGRFIIKLQRNSLSDDNSIDDEEDISKMELDEIEHNYGIEFKKRKNNSNTTAIRNMVYSYSQLMILFFIPFLAYFLGIMLICLFSFEKLKINNEMYYMLGQTTTNMTLTYNLLVHSVYNPLLIYFNNTSNPGASFTKNSENITENDLLIAYEKILLNLDLAKNSYNNIRTSIFINQEEFVNKNGEEIKLFLYSPFCSQEISKTNITDLETIKCQLKFKETLSEFTKNIYSQIYYDSIIQLSYEYFYNRLRNGKSIKFKESSVFNQHVEEGNMLSQLMEETLIKYLIIHDKDFKYGLKMLNFYINPTIEKIQDVTLENINDIITNLKNTKIILFYVVIVLAVSLYLVFTYTQIKLKEDVS